MQNKSIQINTGQILLQERFLLQSFGKFISSAIALFLLRINIALNSFLSIPFFIHFRFRFYCYRFLRFLLVSLA